MCAETKILIKTYILDNIIYVFDKNLDFDFKMQVRALKTKFLIKTRFLAFKNLVFDKN